MIFPNLKSDHIFIDLMILYSCGYTFTRTCEKYVGDKIKVEVLNYGISEYLHFISMKMVVRWLDC